jgi:shikimate kinase
MRHVLITGMSGVGKTTVVGELRRRGRRCLDMDEPGWSYQDAQGHQHWRVERLETALAEAGDQQLFVSGCAEEQAAFYPRFGLMVLLSAPREAMLARIRTRPDAAYGHHPEELAHILEDWAHVEPLLRKACTHEIETTAPVQAVVDRILELASQARHFDQPGS